MIYKIEKRHEFGGGCMETHYEVMSYTHVTPIGILADGECLKTGKTKKEVTKWLKEYEKTQKMNFSEEQKG